MKLSTTSACVFMAGLSLLLPTLSKADNLPSQVTALHPGIAIIIRSLSLEPVVSAVGQKAGARLTMQIGLTSPRPAWWGKVGVGLTGFRITDRQGKQTLLRLGYFGISEPIGLTRDDCLMRYTLPIPRGNIAVLTCIIETNRWGVSIPLAKVTVR